MKTRGTLSRKTVILLHARIFRYVNKLMPVIEHKYNCFVEFIRVHAEARAF